jgi:hypothetical protein
MAEDVIIRSVFASMHYCAPSIRYWIKNSFVRNLTGRVFP